MLIFKDILERDSVSKGNLQRGQFRLLLHHKSRHSWWKTCPQGELLTRSLPRMSTKHTVQLTQTYLIFDDYLSVQKGKVGRYLSKWRLSCKSAYDGGTSAVSSQLSYVTHFLQMSQASIAKRTIRNDVPIPIITGVKEEVLASVPIHISTVTCRLSGAEDVISIRRSSLIPGSLLLRFKLPVLKEEHPGLMGVVQTTKGLKLDMPQPFVRVSLIRLYSRGTLWLQQTLITRGYNQVLLVSKQNPLVVQPIVLVVADWETGAMQQAVPKLLLKHLLGQTQEITEQDPGSSSREA